MTRTDDGCVSNNVIFWGELSTPSVVVKLGKDCDGGLNLIALLRPLFLPSSAIATTYIM